MTRIRGVIFDMDGVLIDAREWHYRALNRALALFGLTISREEHEGGFDGLPTREKLQRLTQRCGLPPSLHGFINEMKQQYTMLEIWQHCWPVFEQRYALAQLKHRGYHIAVASNSVRQSIETMLSRAQLIEYLQFFLSNEDVIRGKPDPEIYLKATNQLKLRPEECVIVEDNPHGIAAARAAGGHVMTVSSPADVTWEKIQAFISQCEEKK